MASHRRLQSLRQRLMRHESYAAKGRAPCRVLAMDIRSLATADRRMWHSSSDKRDSIDVTPNYALERSVMGSASAPQARGLLSHLRRAGTLPRDPLNARTLGVSICLLSNPCTTRLLVITEDFSLLVIGACIMPTSFDSQEPFSRPAVDELPRGPRRGATSKKRHVRRADLPRGWTSALLMAAFTSLYFVVWLLLLEAMVATPVCRHLCRWRLVCTSFSCE